MKQSRQFEHEDVAAVPRGYKVRTVTHPTGHRVRVAFPPGRRSTGSGTLVSILHPKGENPSGCKVAAKLKEKAEGSKQKAVNPKKTKTREQVEAMQTKAVNFLRDVVKDSDKADEIEGLSLAEYAERKKITLSNAGTRGSGLGAKKKRKARRVRNEVVFESKSSSEAKQAAQRVISSGVDKKHVKVRKMWGTRTGWTYGVQVNPEEIKQAEKLFKTFHGKTPKETLELHESAAMRGEYTSLGELVELVVKSVGKETLRLGFAGEKVKLASSPAGTQLYLIGGNQVLDGSLKRFGADTGKDFVELGTAQNIVYRAAKDFTDFKSTDYEHEFGEESGDFPHVFYDKFKQRIFLMGGRYRVERPGIID